MSWVKRIGQMRVRRRSVWLVSIGLVLASALLTVLARGGGNEVREPRSLRPDLVLLPAGTFSMGRLVVVEGQAAGQTAGATAVVDPEHEVTVRVFFLCQTEVTQENWRAVMGGSPSDCKYGCEGTLPVQNISWYDSVAYMNRLTELENRGRSSDAQLSICYEVGRGEAVVWNRNCTG